jgi:hypothetical protein
LFQHFKAGCYWFDKDGLEVRDAVRYDMEIFYWEGEIFRKGAIFSVDAQYPALLAMCGHIHAAAGADVAGDIDFTYYSLANQFWPVGTYLNLPDELVAGNPGKGSIPTLEFQVCVADASA